MSSFVCIYPSSAAHHSHFLNQSTMTHSSPEWWQIDFAIAGGIRRVTCCRHSKKFENLAGLQERFPKFPKDLFGEMVCHPNRIMFSEFGAAQIDSGFLALPGLCTSGFVDAYLAIQRQKICHATSTTDAPKDGCENHHHDGKPVASPYPTDEKSWQFGSWLLCLKTSA
jgi:hypothetical protein